MRGDVEAPLLPASRAEAAGGDAPCLSIGEPRLFLKKTAVIILASYAFIPLIAANQAGHLSAVAYGTVLVALHLFFIAVYAYRVQFRKLDADWRSLALRVIGLLACAWLLYVVAGHMPSSLGLLAVELLGLCAVHTLVLALLMVEVRFPPAGRPAEEAAPGGEGGSAGAGASGAGEGRPGC